MPTRPRIDLAGYHHIINRGVNKTNIFNCDVDKDSFMLILNKNAIIYKVVVHDYVLMDNHFHLLIETQEENLSSFMRVIGANYTQYFNKKYERVGHLWQDRYKSKFITSDDYLYNLIKYIEYNPIDAKITTKISEYKYTLASCIINGQNIYKCCQQSQLLNEFDIKTLIDFLNIKLTAKQIAMLNEKEKIQKKSEEIIYTQTKEFKEHFLDIDTKMKRDRAIISAYKDGYPQVQISKYLKLSTSLVSKVVKSGFITTGVINPLFITQ